MYMCFFPHHSPFPDPSEQNVVFHPFGNVLCEGETARWKAHCPENERPAEFQKATTDFLRSVFNN